MIINHNIAALNTHRQLSGNSNAVQNSLEKLSSGLRINKAGDDAAGLAISEKMRGQIRGLEMASKNAQDGISLIQTAEGALNETHSILQRMRELAVQSASDTNTDSDRAELQKEADQLAEELSRISNNTEFNTQNLAGGNFEGTFHIGANEGQNITLSIDAMDAFSLGVARDVTTYNGTGAGNVDSASFAEEVGSGVKDGATLSFTYSAKGTTINGNGTQTGSDVNDGSVTNADSAVTVSRNTAISDSDAGSYKLEFTSATEFKVLKDDGTGNFTDTGKTGTADGTNLAIGGANVAVAAAASADDSGVYATGDTMSFTITADKTTTSDTVTINSDAQGAVSQTIEVDGTNNQLSVKNGEYEGLNFELSGANTLADVNGSSVTVEESTATASKATFDVDGNMTNEAVAKGGIDISDQDSADKAITTIQSAIDRVSAERSKLGAMQNRLDHTINNLGTSAENLTAAESRIRDVDMAKEMMEFTKNNILSQAAQSMLAQANQQPQGVLQLLR